MISHEEATKGFLAFLKLLPSEKHIAVNGGGLVNSYQYYGGEINYIGVGMLAASYGDTEWLPHMVYYHNAFQWLAGEGSHNLDQMKIGLLWARLGARNY